MSRKSKNIKVTTDTIPGLLQATNKCIAVARRNHKPLFGNNNYAHKFLELRAKSVHLSKSLRQKLTNAESNDVKIAIEKINSLLETFFDPSTTKRSETQKEILFSYRTIIEPVLVGVPDYQPIGELFSLEIIADTRDYIENIGKQANGCFEKGWYDACAVMLRRLLETLIIECYERYYLADLIKGRDGNFLQLRDLILQFLNETTWNPSRNTKVSLPKLKEIGDLSAHNRRYTAKKPDITNFQGDIRIVIQELVYIADFNKK
jgi:hypothetical protein